MRITDYPILYEIKEEYVSIRKGGAGRDQAEEELIARYHDELTSGAEDDGLLFWVGLADAQYSLRELSVRVASMGMQALKSIEDAHWEVTPGDIERRKTRYASAPMPEKKKFGPSRKFRCEWKIGDTFAYQMTGPNAEEYGLTGKYMLFRKVDEMEFDGGYLFPIMTVSYWDKEELPATTAEFLSVPMLKLDNCRLGVPKHLFEYRVEFIVKNKRQLENLNLRYLGNFADVPMPEDEAIIDIQGAVKMVVLERLDINCCYYWRNHPIYERRKGK